MMLRTIALALTIVLTPLSAFAGGGGKAQQVFDTLNSRYGLHVKVSVANNGGLNAWTDGYNIVIDSGLLRVSTNELAFVIGHEMGHVMGGGSESAADRASVRILASSPYSACAGGTSYFKRIIRLHGDVGGGKDPHPKASARLATIQRTAC